MTGGWARREEVPAEPAPEEPEDDADRLIEAGLKRWTEVWRIRRTTNRALRMQGTSLPQWRVLYATAQLLRTTPEGPCEQAVARRTDMDVTTVSRVLHRLERKGLVDRGLEECAFTYHVLLESVQGEVESFAEALAFADPDPDDDD